MATSRRSSTPLSRERILDAAQSIVVSEGASALSMRRVAAELGTGAMSLYNHVRDKEALQVGLAERVLAQVQVPVGASRHELCATWTRSVRRTLLANHAILPIILSLPRRSALGEIGRLLGGALVATGMAERDARDVTAVLGRYIAGSMVFDGAASRRGDVDADELDRTFELGLDALLRGLDALLSRDPEPAPTEA